MTNESTPTRSRHSFDQQENASQDGGLLQHANDDEAERQRRQQELLLELQSRHLESPGTPASMRKSMGIAPAGLSNVQLAEHYANCIRLSTENKITTKNAFSLHLIDYMHKMLRNEDGTTNFQAASCTLDAGTKIYAYRVDRIHSETLQIAGELGITSKKKKRSEEEPPVEGGNGEETGPEKMRKTKKTKGGNTIVHNVKSITIDDIEVMKYRDPLLEKISENHEESTTAGLFLNHVRTLDDFGRLMFGPGFVPTVSDLKEDQNATTELTDEIFRTLKRVASRKLTLCPSMSELSMYEDSDESPLPETNVSIRQPGPEASFYNNDAADVADVSDEDDNQPWENPDCNNATCGPITGCSTAEMSKFLAPVPSDYSYFTKQFFSAWAGPAHWRIKPLSKLKPKEAVRRKPTKLSSTFDFETANSALFVRSKQSHLLTKRMLSVWKAEKLLLPHDHRSTEAFRSLLLCKGHKIMRVSKPGTVGESEVTYDYGNANDNENFCPNESDNNDVPADDTHVGLGSPTAGNAPTSAAVLDNTLFVNSTKLQYDYTGDNLVKQPYKIQKIQINYARVAKRFDMKQMKQAIWNVLTHDNEDKENVNQSEEPPGAKDCHLSFRSVCHLLPSHLNRINRESVTIPIAFTALLHLATERNFTLSGREDISDVVINV
ncbi:condensin complex subunit 2-like [Ornithodoros turicata]|uniref:condensin complex subunit 2-like n=1 Tax=Ornithodoros turicata TaxID=34597 RepID=UPI0031391B65